jgi:hypothetical protein
VERDVRFLLVSSEQVLPKLNEGHKRTALVTGQETPQGTAYTCAHTSLEGIAMKWRNTL